MDKEKNSPTSQPSKGNGEPLPGTSQDPTGQVITDKPAQGRDRQEQGSGPSRGSSVGDRNSGAHNNN